MGSATFPFVDENGVTQILWRRTCLAVGRLVAIPQTTPADILPQLLEQLKERSLPRPSPAFQMLDPENNWAYVTVPVDFRAGGNSWRTISVTASIGPVWALWITVPAVEWCSTRAIRVQPRLLRRQRRSPDRRRHPGVMYTYTSASSTSSYDGFLALTTTIDWAISWTSSSGAGGALEPYSTSATAELAVAEVKGLVTCTGSRSEQGGC